MEEAGFEEMGSYVLKSQNAVAQYIKMRTIMDLYKDMVHRSGAWFYMRWWEKEGLDPAVQGQRRRRKRTGKGRVKGNKRVGRRQRAVTEDMGYAVAH